MSEDTPAVVETVAASTDDVIEAVAATVEAAPQSVAAVETSAATPAKPFKLAKKQAPRAAAKRAAAVAKPATVKLPVKRSAKPRAAAVTVEKVSPKASAPVAKRKYVRKVIAAVQPVTAPVLRSTSTNPYTQGVKIMENTNWFAGFNSVPGADKFQTLFAGAGEKSQEAVRKGQAIAESMTETARANVEAVVESTRIATAGARDLGQEFLASTKGGVEQATSAVKTLAEAKSPTEFFQLQSELVRASFDRFVAEGSKLTEQMVKLAGEASQPLSSRASVNAEKFSELTA